MKYPIFSFVKVHCSYCVCILSLQEYSGWLISPAVPWVVSSDLQGQAPPLGHLCSPSPLHSQMSHHDRPNNNIKSIYTVTELITQLIICTGIYTWRMKILGLAMREGQRFPSKYLQKEQVLTRIISQQNTILIMICSIPYYSRKHWWEFNLALRVKLPSLKYWRILIWW